MARPRTAAVADPPMPKGFVASAVNLPTMDRNVAGAAAAWQLLAWQYWEEIGELRYPTSWIGNVMSRATLAAARRDPDTHDMVIHTDGAAAEAMDELFNGPQGQSEMLQAFGVHLTVAGEGYLVHLDGEDEWYVVATGKVTGGSKRGNREIKVDLGRSGGATVINPARDFILRIWTPHPRNTTQADSPTRANLTTLGQIKGYDAHINAQIESRLTGAGILLLPSEIDFAVPQGADPAASPADNFIATLGEAMMTPIKNRSSAAAIVPLVVMAPGEHLAAAQHLKFWTDLDEKVITMRDAGIRRLALGLDVPAEVLLGVADANHWNAWLSEESAIKAHIEPRLATVSHGLTTGYLRPAITGEVPDPQNWYTVADSSAIRLRPNRSAEALELYDRGELSGLALLRETGFQPVDAPGSDEFRRWLLRKIATGSTSPEQTQAALAILGADLGPIIVSGTNAPPPDDIRTDTQPRRPVKAIPDMPDEPLVAACEVLVYRALERAGNRLRNLHRLTDTSAMSAHTVYQLHTGDPDHLLEGAWECAPEVLSAYVSDAANVVDVLDFYTRGLLSTKRPASRVVLAKLLDTRPVPLEVGS